MATLKQYNLAGQLLKEVVVEDDVLPQEVCSQMIKDYLVALRANARQWSANTKTRAEVNHSGQKPHPQKGMGRARQGYLGAAQYKGGGRVFGPRPKFDQHVRINRKERRAAVRFLLAEKIRNNQLHFLELDSSLGMPKTKVVAEFMRKVELEGSRVLFMGDTSASSESCKYDVFLKSMRNIPKTEFRLLQNINGYDVTLSRHIVVMTAAKDELMVLLKGEA